MKSMTHWSELIEHHFASAFSRNSIKVNHFTKDSPEQLWAWQGHKRVNIKESLGLELPAIYSPPKARVIIGHPNEPEKGQTWHVESELDVLLELHLRTSPLAVGKNVGYVLQICEQSHRQTQKEFCSSIIEMGLVGLSVSPRGSYEMNGIQEFAELYQGLGRCYAGAAVYDLIRVIDHMEHHFKIDIEPIVLVLSGKMIPIGLALGAIDQRISAVIIDFTHSAAPPFVPDGSVPLFKQVYDHLGPNPWLILTQCFAPRPITLIHLPAQSEESWLKNPKAGVMSFSNQIESLSSTYEAAEYPQRLTIIPTDKPRPSLMELVKQSLELFLQKK
jgi:hypothetical protein